MPESEFYSVEEVAALLNIEPRKVRRLIADNKLPAHRIGKRLRIKKVDYVAFLRRTRTMPEEDEELEKVGA